MTKSVAYSSKLNTLIDKHEFYRGAALIRLVNDVRLKSLTPHASGYLINNGVYAIVKYSTKATTPWRFTFTPGELKVVDRELKRRQVVLALVCGGDGICAVSWDELEPYLGESRSWVSCRREFNKRYAIAGTDGELPGRVPHNHWPGVAFAEEE